MKLAPISLLLALCLTLRCAAAAELVVIDLHNRTAEELLPVLRPVAGGASLSGLDYKLFVRGDAADIDHVKQMLATLDRPPQQLLISVRYSAGPVSSDISARAGGTATKNGVAVSIDAGKSLSTASDHSVSTIRVLEGNGAHISSGQSVPVVSGVFLASAKHERRNSAAVGTDYHDVTNGFDVLPRVNGDRVVLEISSQQQHLDGQGYGSTSTQRAATTVSGKLGQWIEVGRVGEAHNEQQTAVGTSGGAHRVATQSDDRTIAVKVEKSE